MFVVYWSTYIYIYIYVCVCVCVCESVCVSLYTYTHAAGCCFSTDCCSLLTLCLHRKAALVVRKCVFINGLLLWFVTEACWLEQALAGGVSAAAANHVEAGHEPGRAETVRL